MLVADVIDAYLRQVRVSTVHTTELDSQLLVVCHDLTDFQATKDTFASEAPHDVIHLAAQVGGLGAAGAAVSLPPEITSTSMTL